MDRKDKFYDQTVHFIWAGYEANDRCFGRKSGGYRSEIVQIFYKVMTEYRIQKPFMITFLWRWRGDCKVLEIRDAAYKSEMSIGENLENYITGIKNNNYRYENKGLESERLDSFLYTMLTPQEERKLNNLDDEFLLTFLRENPDIPKNELEKSDSNHKYVHSRGVRVTYII